jgi:hypothetical protein
VEIRKAPAWRFSFWYTAQMDESEKINELQIAAKEYSELLAEYRAKRTQREDIPQASFVTFEGIEEEKDAYNPSGPFRIEDTTYSKKYPETYQWARVESRTAQDAVAMLFEETEKNVFTRVKNISALPIEDPFICQIGDEIVVGGVEISKDEHDRVIGYHTAFYRGASLDSLSLFTVAPDGMKDIRLAELPMGEGKNEFSARIVVFTRPHIPVHARMMGRIAVTTIASLDELTTQRLAVEFTQIVPGLFTDTEWGGVNDVYVLKNGLVGALCHIAKFDDNNKRHYAAAVFVLDAASVSSATSSGTINCSPLEIIAERADFPMGPIKIMPENLNNPEMYDDLADVIFSSRLVAVDAEGGMIAQNADTMMASETLSLTCGLSDAATGVLLIPNPFPKIIEKYFPEKHY